MRSIAASSISLARAIMRENMLEVEDWRDERERKRSRMTQTQTQNDHNRRVNDGKKEACTSGNGS